MPHSYVQRPLHDQNRGGWLPDIASPHNPGVVEIRNAVPTLHGLAGVPDFASDFTYEVGLEGEVVTGAFWGRDPYGDALSVVATRLQDEAGNAHVAFRGLQGRHWVDMTPIPAPEHGPGRWQFVQVGTSVYAMNGGKTFVLALEPYYAPVVAVTKEDGELISHADRSYTFGSRSLETHQNIVVRLPDFILASDDIGYEVTANNEGVVDFDVTTTGILNVNPVTVGETTLSVVAMDLKGRSTRLALTFVVPNQRPIVNDDFLPEIMVTAGSSTNVDISDWFTDTAGDVLTYMAVSNAFARATFSGTTMTISGIKAGSTSLGITATDQGGLASVRIARIRVT